jgi:hypothetical protein
MLNFPYDITALLIEPINPPDELSDDEWLAYFTQRDHRICDARLDAISADAAAIPGAIGMCVVTGAAHDYTFLNVVVQLADGGFLTLSKSDTADGTITFTPIRLDLDLPTELQQLKADGTIVRGPGNHNIDHKRGYEGRISTIYIVVGSEAEWVRSPRPLLGGEHANNAVNRIYRAMLGMEQAMTLI